MVLPFFISSLIKRHSLHSPIQHFWCAWNPLKNRGSNRENITYNGEITNDYLSLYLLGYFKEVKTYFVFGDFKEVNTDISKKSRDFINIIVVVLE